jgi:hypothetical protein
MLISAEIAALFPAMGEWDKPFSWSFFVVGKEPSGSLIGIGTLEHGTGLGRKLEVQAHDLSGRGSLSSVVMYGGASLSHSKGVNITGGGVYVEPDRLKGHGIGTLMLNVTTAWACRTFPGETVEPITMINPADGDRLARFYGRFGFKWTRPANDWWKGRFPSEPMMVADLKQYPEKLLPNVRRVNFPAAMTLIFDRMMKADDDRRAVVGLGEVLRDRRERWRTIGYRLDKVGLVLAALAGFCAARAFALL